MPTAIFCKIFHGLLFWMTLWMCVQNLKSIALPVPEIIGGTPKIWEVPGYANNSSKFFNGALVGMHPMNVPAKFQVHSFTCSWVNSGYPKKLGQSLPMPTLSTPHTLQKYLYAYHTDYLSMCTRFPAIFDCSFEWRLRTPKLGDGEAVRGQG